MFFVVKAAYVDRVGFGLPVVEFEAVGCSQAGVEMSEEESGK